MRIFYGLTKAIKDSLESNEVTSVVTFGDLTDVDLQRQTIFPLAHIVPNPATFEGPVINMELNITLADIVDYSEEETKIQTEPFYGNNNLQDVLDTQLYVANMLVQQLQRGDLWDLDYKLVSAVAEPFMDRYENVLAGFILSVSVQIRNTDISIC